MNPVLSQRLPTYEKVKSGGDIEWNYFLSWPIASEDA
jgi:hypothetical protein